MPPLQFREANLLDEVVLFPMMRSLADGNDSALELYRRTGFEDHDRFLMTKWLNREDQ